MNSSANVIRDNSRHWSSVILDRECSDAFREFLVDMGIYFETSECLNFVYFEMFVDNVEKATCDKFLGSI